jgi:hypothetical protein
MGEDAEEYVELQMSPRTRRKAKEAHEDGMVNYASLYSNSSSTSSVRGFDLMRNNAYDMTSESSGSRT